MTRKKHARRSCSSAKRWMNCPGSLNLSDKCPPQEASEYAQEGTNAHYLAESCLRVGDGTRNADHYIGEIMSEKGGEEFLVTEDMAEAVQVYLDYVRTKISSIKNPIVSVEQKFSLEWLYKDMFGTNDCMIFDPTKKLLTIVDYKNGATPVSPEWNQQLMMYGLGAIRALWDELTKGKPTPALKLVENVELVIVQPNAFDGAEAVKSWSISSNELFYWALHVLRPAAVLTDSPDAPLKVGDYCKTNYCPALGICPAVMDKAMAVAKTTFENPTLPDPEDLSTEDILKVLEVSEIFGSWVEKVKDFARGQMFLGMNIPGHKLVQRKSNRKWINEMAACSALEQVIGENAYSKKVLTVAQAEKALKAANISPEATLSGLWIKPDTGVAMVKESDRRKAVVPSAIADFTNDDDFLN